MPGNRRSSHRAVYQPEYRARFLHSQLWLQLHGCPQSSRPVSTQVDVPLQMETGTALMEVVANGIPSPTVTVTIQ
jgi:hypothetical protein